MGIKAYVLYVTLAAVVVQAASHVIYYVPQTGFSYLPTTTSIRRVQVLSNPQPIKQQIAINQVEALAANPAYILKPQVPVSGPIQYLNKPINLEANPVLPSNNYVYLYQQPVLRQGGIVDSIWNFFGFGEENKPEEEQPENPEDKPQEGGEGDSSGASEGEEGNEGAGSAAEGSEEPSLPEGSEEGSQPAGSPEIQPEETPEIQPEETPEIQPSEEPSHLAIDSSEPRLDLFKSRIPVVVQSPHNNPFRQVFLRYYNVPLTREGEGEEEEGGDGVEIGPDTPGPSIAQAKPAAIALAGPGGVAAAAPQATAIVGPGGLAVAQPSATAVAGPGAAPPPPQQQLQYSKNLMYNYPGHALRYDSYPHPLVAYRF